MTNIMVNAKINLQCSVPQKLRTTAIRKHRCFSNYLKYSDKMDTTGSRNPMSPVITTISESTLESLRQMHRRHLEVIDDKYALLPVVGLTYQDALWRFSLRFCFSYQAKVSPCWWEFEQACMRNSYFNILVSWTSLMSSRGKKAFWFIWTTYMCQFLHPSARLLQSS